MMQKFDWKNVKGDARIQYDEYTDSFTITFGDVTIEGISTDIMRKLEDDYDEAWLDKMMKKDYKNTFEASRIDNMLVIVVDGFKRSVHNPDLVEQRNARIANMSKTHCMTKN